MGLVFCSAILLKYFGLEPEQNLLKLLECWYTAPIDTNQHQSIWALFEKYRVKITYANVTLDESYINL